MGRSKELPWLFFFMAMAAKAMAIFCETPIPKAQHIGIGKLNNPAAGGGDDTQPLGWNLNSKAGFIPVIKREGKHDYYNEEPSNRCAN